MVRATSAHVMLLATAVLSLAATGCCDRTDFYARKLVVHTRTPGKLWLASLGPEQRLLASGRIDATRRIQTSDGIWIDLWLIRARDVNTSRGTVVLIHGLTGSRGLMYTAGQRVADRGFDVILPDLRGHGRSTGTYTTFGPAEAADLAVVIDRLLADGDAHGPVYIVGRSLGGATAVHLAARRDDCRGVVAIAPVADVRLILRRLLLGYAPLMTRKSVNATINRAGEIARFDVDAADSTDAARNLRCPILVAHGALDAIVPVSHGKRVYEAAPDPKRLDIIHWAGHVSILMGRAEWIAEQVDAMARGEFRPDSVGEQN